MECPHSGILIYINNTVRDNPAAERPQRRREAVGFPVGVRRSAPLSAI